MEVLNSLPSSGGKSEFKTVQAEYFANLEVTGIPAYVHRGRDGLLYRRKAVDPKLPKGEGMPKKDPVELVAVEVNYYEEFLKDCPGCTCDSCPHALECQERVLPNEGYTILQSKLARGDQWKKAGLKIKV